MPVFSWPRRRFWLLYPAWILICVALFFALRQLPDPARPSGRIDRDSASRLALQYLVQSNARYGSHTPEHIAFSPSGELGPEARWVVLCYRDEASGFHDAMVVEVRASDGALIRIRRPVVK